MKDFEKETLKTFSPNLDRISTLPTEVLLRIFELIDVETLHNSVYNVCLRFRNILEDNLFWRTYFISIYGPKCHMILNRNCEIDYHSLLEESQKRESLWRNQSKNYLSFDLKTVHYGCVDSIHLMEQGRLVVTGSRDRSIAICNLTKSFQNFPNRSDDIVLKTDAHGGWVWSITSYESRIYTGSWDNTIKVWSFENGSIQLVNKFNGQQAVLSLAAKENMLAAGLWANQVKLFDTRLGFDSLHEYDVHRQAVLDITILNNLILSCSEDRTVAIYDFRAQKLITKIRIPNRLGMPLKLCCASNVIYVGDTRGSLHLIDPTSFKVNGSIKVADKNITGIAIQPGMIATSSSDEYIRLCRPSSPPYYYYQLKHFDLPVSLDYLNDIMAVGYSGSPIKVWLPTDSPVLSEPYVW